MYAKWRRQIRRYINAKVREAIEWLYSVGVSKIKAGYPKVYCAEERQLQ
jgi:putative transposase